MATFITGASGFIGKTVTQHLLEEGEEVHALIHNSDIELPRSYEHLKVFKGDIEDPESIRKAMKGCDQVYHLAALATPWVKDHSLFYRVNVQGTKNVLRIASEEGVSKMVHTSSAATLGPQKGGSLVTEAQSLDLEDALTYYESTKIQAEEAVRNSVQEQGLNVVIVNPTRLFGPGPFQASNSVTRILRDHLNGDWRIIPGSGKSVGNYVFTKNVMQGMLLAMKHGKSGERYLLGGENADFRTFFKKWERITGCRRRMIRIPVPFLLMASFLMQAWAAITRTPPLITSGWVRKYLLNDWGADPSKARNELGYRPMTLNEGMQETYEWLLSEDLVKERGNGTIEQKGSSLTTASDPEAQPPSAHKGHH